MRAVVAFWLIKSGCMSHPFCSISRWSLSVSLKSMAPIVVVDVRYWDRIEFSACNVDDKLRNSCKQVCEALSDVSARS